MTRLGTLLGALAGFVAAVAAVSERTCYYPNGNVSPADVPCTDDANTHCCSTKAACLSIGYCLSAESQPYLLSRGSCTDDAWGSGCPARCASSSDNPSGGRPLSWLGKTNAAGQHQYCCGTLINNDGAIACENRADPFTLGSATLLFDAAVLANTTDTTTTDTTNTTNTTDTADTTTSSASASSASASASSGTVSKGAVAGVGASLGAAALAAVAWALLERRKRRRLEELLRAGAPSGTGLYQGSSGVAALATSSVSPGPGGYYNKVPSELAAFPREQEMAA